MDTIYVFLGHMAFHLFSVFVICLITYTPSNSKYIFVMVYTFLFSPDPILPSLVWQEYLGRIFPTKIWIYVCHSPASFLFFHPNSVRCASILFNFSSVQYDTLEGVKSPLDWMFRKWISYTPCRIVS